MGNEPFVIRNNITLFLSVFFLRTKMFAVRASVIESLHLEPTCRLPSWAVFKHGLHIKTSGGEILYPSLAILQGGKG
jgi:hypothetical protein